MAKQLNELTRKMLSLSGAKGEKAVFEMLKHRLSTAPVLASPLAEEQYILHEDASGHGAGAIFQQGGKERVTSYASHLFNLSERPYCVTRQELAVVVFG